MDTRTYIFSWFNYRHYTSLNLPFQPATKILNGFLIGGGITISILASWYVTRHRWQQRLILTDVTLLWSQGGVQCYAKATPSIFTRD